MKDNDPDACLDEMLELAIRLQEAPPEHGWERREMADRDWAGERLGWLTLQMHKWMASGGNLPRSWSRKL